MFWIGRSLWMLVVIGLLVSGWGAPVGALPAKSAIKDAATLLRNALPIDSPEARDLQHSLEGMPRQANLKRWGALHKEVERLQNLVTAQVSLLDDVRPEAQGTATALLSELATELAPLREAIDQKKRDPIKPLTAQALATVGELEALMVKGFPYEIPAKYQHLPQLKGRAIVELTTSQGTVLVTVDGYSAPITAGQFVDLVNRGFYDGTTFSRADENYYLQAGDPPGADIGYVDAAGNLRTIPLEIRLTDNKPPVYEKPLTDELWGLEAGPSLPFSVYGTLAMARPGNDPNGASSQFFIYLFESDLTPAGLNLMDGNYAPFGYVTQDDGVLYKLRLGDEIQRARVVSGLENLVLPAPPSA
ncbi:MAG: peptidylprolyl isomerase [Oscillatoriales cyanobacterium SM2_1_8]|nr:peptidylprolyl isomerase [Oscillatoriales cyanobacterium SM2_1_8]